MTTTRAAIVARARELSERAYAYSQSTYTFPPLPGSVNYYRSDCSGFAERCAGRAAPGLDTVGMVTTGAYRKIARGAARAGDFFGMMGAGTGGNDGHVMVIVEVRGDFFTVREQTPSYGPQTNIYQWSDFGSQWAAYELVDLQEAPVSTQFIPDDNTAEVIQMILAGKHSGGYADASQLPAGTSSAVRDMYAHIGSINVAAQLHALAASLPAGTGTPAPSGDPAALKAVREAVQAVSDAVAVLAATVSHL